MGETSSTSQIMDFTVRLCRAMMECGANLERVAITARRIGKCYALREISVVVVNDVLMISCRDADGRNHIRQEKVPGSQINLARLKRLNILVHQVMETKPAPETLEDRLFEVLLQQTGYSERTVIIGYVLAMICLCLIFGGVWQDIVVVVINTVILYYVMKVFTRERLNRIISNVVSMFICGCLAFLFTGIGFSKSIPTILITNAFYLIPGIPMINAFRNILCGNEMNGIIEMVKVTLEVLTIVTGLYISWLICGSGAVGFI